MAKKKEEQEKPSFVLYTEHIEQFDSLSDAQAGQLIKAILHYVAEGEAYIEDPVVSAMMMFIRQTLDRDRKKWEETRQKRVEAGKKGGEESARRRKEQEANAAFAEANQAVNGNVNEYVNEYVNGNGYGNGYEYVNENVVVSANNNNDYYYCNNDDDNNDNEPDPNSFIRYGREQYLTTPAELEQIMALADALLYNYRNKIPTPDDYEKVFHYVHTIAVNDAGEHYGIYSEEKADLLCHVFDEASLRSDMSWQYINRIYATYSQYGVETVEDALEYEDWWNHSQTV